MELVFSVAKEDYAIRDRLIQYSVGRLYEEVEDFLQKIKNKKK